MTAERPASIIAIPGPGRFAVFSEGEVLCGEFDGNPLVSVFDADGKSGCLCRIKRDHLESEFWRWLEAVRTEYGRFGMQRLQIKFIALTGDEPVLRQLCAKHGVKPTAIAGFDDKSKLDVFFITDQGRLRIAPITPQVMRDAPKPQTQKKEAPKTRVLIVDDSKTIRLLLRKILTESPEFEVVAEAERPSQVEELIMKHKPDVMTLDINMPEMTGVQLLRKILNYRFIPTVMISSLNIDEGNEVLDALELGAVDYIQKPAARDVEAIAPLIREKIQNASRVRRAGLIGLEEEARKVVPHNAFSSISLLAIGASTGGTEAIKQIFVSFPKEVPPIVVVQHIPPYFSTAFAKRLNELCKFEVREAKDGDEIKPGLALIAPGDYHMEVVRERRRMIARLSQSAPVNRFRPSVDVLFNSVAKNVGMSATGVLLTGMGTDGAKGLLAMKETGSITIAQDEDSCVVYGMPRAAKELGAATFVESLDEISNALMSLKAA